MGQATAKNVMVSAIGHPPTIKLFFEPRDLPALVNLEQWSEHLLQQYEQKTVPLIGGDLLECSELEVLFNNLPLIMAYQGQFEQSRTMLTNINQLWFERYKTSPQVDYLKKTIQPTINLARLDLMQGHIEQFWQSLNRIDVLHQNYLQLGEHRITADTLPDEWPMFMHISVYERVKALLQTQQFEAVVALAKDLPPALLKSRVYREAQIIALLNLGQYEQAKSIIRGGMYQTDGIAQCSFYYRLYELCCRTGEYDKAQLLLADIVCEAAVYPCNSLEQLNFVIHLIERSGSTEASPLTQTVLAQLAVVEDEFYYGKLLVHLHRMAPTAMLTDKLKRLYSKTDYALLRKKIARQLNFVAEEVPASPVFTELNRKVAQLFAGVR